MNKLEHNLRKLVVSLIGFPLFVLGIILIPAPGPGLLVSFLALLILSTEYDWAQREQKKARAKFKEIYEKAKARADKIEHLSDSDKKSIK